MTTVERPTASWQPPAQLAGIAVALTALACLVGALGWLQPQRTPGGWQVADVPSSLLAVVVGTGLVCLAVAAVALRRPPFGSSAVAATFWVMALVSVFAQGWNDVYLAALADPAGGPIIPVFDWLFAFVPAAVVGAVARHRGRTTHLRATIGSGIVTLPMHGLGWALYGAAEGLGNGLSGGLYSTVVSGLVPLVIAFVLTRPRS